MSYTVDCFPVERRDLVNKRTSVQIYYKCIGLGGTVQIVNLLTVCMVFIDVRSESEIKGERICTFPFKYFFPEKLFHLFRTLFSVFNLDQLIQKVGH